jgi:hypothetical protein
VVAQGDLKTALKSYSDGLAIKERLAKSDPAGWQRDLSVSYERVGDVQLAQDDLKADRHWSLPRARRRSDGPTMADGDVYRHGFLFPISSRSSAPKTR